MARRRASMAGLLVIAAGCAAGDGGRGVRLEAPDPADRIRAIVAEVERGDGDPRQVVAALVDRLEDEDQAVRFYAIAGLSRLTGRRMGFRAYDPPPARRIAVARWREHLAQTSAELESRP